ncbi:hypothetical protein ACQ4XT_08590 [Halobacillus faecis]
MKKVILISLVVMFLIVLTSCGNDRRNEAEAVSGESKQAEQEKVSGEDKHAESKGKLEQKKISEAEVGEVFETDFLEKVTLYFDNDLQQHIELGSLQLNIERTTIIQGEGFKSDDDINLFYNEYGYEENDPINILWIDHSVENTSETPLKTNDIITKVILNTGEQIDVFENNFMEWGDNEFYGNSFVNELSVGLPFDSNPEEVTSFRIITGEVYDMDYNDITAPVEATLELK